MREGEYTLWVWSDTQRDRGEKENYGKNYLKKYFLTILPDFFGKIILQKISRDLNISKRYMYRDEIVFLQKKTF